MGKPGEVNWEDWMSTVQPVNLPRANAPETEVVKKKEPIVVGEEDSPEHVGAKDSVRTPAGSEGTMVEEGSNRSSSDGSQATDAKGALVPVLAPVVAVEKEEVK